MPKKRSVKRHPVAQPLDQSYRLIPLTQGQNAIVDVGDFDWLSRFNWFAHWCEDTKSFYAARSCPHHKILPMHREILGCGPREQGDHKNHNTLDNRKENLRRCLKIHNSQNQRKRGDNSSGFKGVSLDKGRWRGNITINKNRIFLGYFTTPKEAAKAYDKAAKELHGEFAHLNFPPSES